MLSHINPEKPVNQITKEERKNLVDLMKGLELTIKGARPINEAIVTSGGISTDEINPSTMESKLVKGLFFAGEIIDVDGYTGGYNLTIAFSTGYNAGLNC
jgi:predicted Rossmann fold flavoprotein